MDENSKKLDIESMSHEEFMDVALRCMFGPGIESADRAPILQKIMEHACLYEEIVWALFQRVWSVCDGVDEEILTEIGEQLFGYVSRGTEHLSGDAKAFYDSLPDEVIVYRGSSPDRKRGWSWTTSQSIAKGFAIGHRFISVRNGTVYEGIARKADILTVFVDRGEFEVFLHPSTVRRLRVKERIQRA